MKKKDLELPIQSCKKKNKVEGLILPDIKLTLRLTLKLF